LITVARPTGADAHREQLTLSALLPPGSSALPDDFPSRLCRIKDSSGLSWNELAEKLGVDPRQVARWRRGAEPSGGAMLALIQFAMLLPGGHQVLLSNGDAAASRPTARGSRRRPS
jgi:hypothetical protein